MHGTASTSSSIRSGFSALLLSSSISFSMFSLQCIVNNQHDMPEQRLSEGPIGLTFVEPQMMLSLRCHGCSSTASKHIESQAAYCSAMSGETISSYTKHKQHKEKTQRQSVCTDRLDSLYLMAYLHARWQISVMSAPENPLVYLTSSAVSTSSATGDLRSTALKIWVRLPSSGNGM